MSLLPHSYDASCQQERPFPPAPHPCFKDCPPLRARFFYTAALALDDPLAPLPRPGPSSAAARVKHPSRPFAPADNAALERAWSALDPTRNTTGDHEADSILQSSRQRQDDEGVVSGVHHEPAQPSDSPMVDAPPTSLRLENLAPDMTERELQGLLAMSHQLDAVDFVRSGAVDQEAFRSATARFRSFEAAETARDMLHGKPNLTATANMRAELTHDRSIDPDTVDRPHHMAAEGGGRPPLSVLVGVSRLHRVELPTLLMKPIYWSPLHDISAVARGTWFYRDTMVPLPASVANRLEIGHANMRPWSQTWKDELNSALRVGAEGEEKVTHPIWPDGLGSQVENEPIDPQRPRQDEIDILHQLTSDRLTCGRADQLPWTAYSAEGASDDGQLLPSAAENNPPRLYANSSVLYINAFEAYILRPGLMPSAYFGRRPLAKIRKGISVGIRVIRGFDPTVWDKLHPPSTVDQQRKPRNDTVHPRQSGEDDDPPAPCPACASAGSRPPVTDLILVVHGIGQKLSERVESFHFTHAINSFRRQCQVELASDVVRDNLRPDMGGIMVLPINWRSTLTLEDGGPLAVVPTTGDAGDVSTANGFGLKDITPPTIPSIRNMISDVMLDIPYYLSHHKPKMVRAVVREANRVYGLWCENNPGFHPKGRVHLIAHSLGSAMALDILSNQPTTVPRHLDQASVGINENHFLFDTKSAFFCGSPAGFFLLLNRSSLTPRRGRAKLGTEDDGVDPSICGEAGRYGCLAVDNLYNVVNFNDPVAYLLGSALDAAHAASLKPAVVPNTTMSIFHSIGNVLWSKPAARPVDAGESLAEGLKPNMARLPSTIEMETHNFTQEEMAEKRFHLLNDNGQIDWFLSSGGGPLEIQYLNMLGAHSSYWVSRDFVRFVVLEVGRRPGPTHTLPAMRAVKKTFRP
ncbi:MAG: hypothetical protein M1817_005510 [Caeruleum heppii]|nr:MAG: hypothetical protein M1817_005510 [Caeruleum heppii]